MVVMKEVEKHLPGNISYAIQRSVVGHDNGAVTPKIFHCKIYRGQIFTSKRIKITPNSHSGINTGNDVSCVNDGALMTQSWIHAREKWCVMSTKRKKRKSIEGNIH